MLIEVPPVPWEGERTGKSGIKFTIGVMNGLRGSAVLLDQVHPASLPSFELENVRHQMAYTYS